MVLEPIPTPTIELQEGLQEGGHDGSRGAPKENAGVERGVELELG